jgi:hypothetical protein
VSCSSVEFPDLPGGTSQVGVIRLRRHVVFFGLCEESAEPQRLFAERQRRRFWSWGITGFTTSLLAPGKIALEILSGRDLYAGIVKHTPL